MIPVQLCKSALGDANFVSEETIAYFLGSAE